MPEKSVVILHVEDDPAHRLLVKESLINHSVTNKVIEMEDGQEAIDYLYGRGEYADREKCPLPDLILLDIKMPVMDGFEVLKELKNDPEMKHIPVIMLTTSTKEEEVAMGYNFGANAYVTKPLDFSEFAKKLKDIKLFWTLTAEKSKR